MRPPYVSITDFLTGSQARLMLQVWRESDRVSPRQLAVGVMMSWKTLHGQPTKWSVAFPKNEVVADIFVDEPDVFNVLHYADYDGQPVLENLERAIAWGGPNLHGLQLDMIWPDAVQVRAFRERHPDIRIILQANTRALAVVGDDPAALICGLGEYGDSIDYVLLDKSGGKGLGMSAEILMPFARAVAEHLPRLSLAAAGGLGPDTLELVRPLAEAFPEISIDAQGRLRPSGDALDPVDWRMAETYLRRAATLFESVR